MFKLNVKLLLGETLKRLSGADIRCSSFLQMHKWSEYVKKIHKQCLITIFTMVDAESQSIWTCWSHNHIILCSKLRHVLVPLQRSWFSNTAGCRFCRTAHRRSDSKPYCWAASRANSAVRSIFSANRLRKVATSSSGGPRSMRSLTLEFKLTDFRLERDRGLESMT